MLSLVSRPQQFLASSRPRRPGAYGAEACVEGPGAASSRIERCAPPRASLSLAPTADAAIMRRTSGAGHSPSGEHAQRRVELRVLGVAVGRLLDVELVARAGQRDGEVGRQALGRWSRRWAGTTA